MEGYGSGKPGNGASGGLAREERRDSGTGKVTGSQFLCDALHICMCICIHKYIVYEYIEYINIVIITNWLLVPKITGPF